MAAAAGGKTSDNKPSSHDGPDLQEIQTDQLGFAGLNRDTETQLRLLPEPWPADALPPPSASLLAVSSKGIVAAAGPNHLVLARTDQIRTALQSADNNNAQKTRDFEPNITIEKPGLGHVVFSSTQDLLVVSSQRNGGLEAYQLSSLLNGEHEPTLTVSTDQVALRALVPNPNLDKAELFAAVTNNGDLLLADIIKGALSTSKSSSSTTFLSGVSCVSWSNKGNKLYAGLANGTAIELKPADGSVAAEIPKPTALPDGHYVSSICCLEKDSFLFIYTSSATDQGILPSEYYIITRCSDEYTFQKLPEVILPFGMERIPTHHFLLRLRKFPPHLKDLIILSATSSSDVGLISKADQPLSKEDPVTGDFTTTVISIDSKRAQLPLSDANQMDTSPIGMALDLSSKEPVVRPIPSDEEILQTSGPCPNVLILNNEGILLSWWLIYDDSVRQKTLFSGFDTAAVAKYEQSPNSAKKPSSPPSAPASTSLSAVSSPSPLAKRDPPQASSSSFAAPTATFGGSATAPASTSLSAANSPSPFAKGDPPKASSTSFATPTATFGGSTPAPAFGQPSAIGKTTPSWASAGFANSTAAQSTAPAFGQPAFGQPAFGQPAFGSPSTLGGASAPSSFAAAPAFGKPSFGAASSSLVGSAATTSPFASTATSQTSGFAAFSGKGGFGTAALQGRSSSPFASVSGNNAFGKSAVASPFSGLASNAEKSPFGNVTSFKLQSSFTADPKPDEDEDEDEDTKSEDGSHKSSFDFANGLSDTLNSAKVLVTPPSTIGPPKATSAPKVSELFGTTPKDDAPVPPDFLLPKISSIPEEEHHALPSQDDGSELSDGFENSGEEVEEEEISPIEATTEDDLDVRSDENPDHIQTSPESSFKSGDQSLVTSPTGGLFTNISLNNQKPARPLFGEVGSTGPILPPPKPKESPRSPSPVRSTGPILPPPQPQESPRSPSPVRRLPPTAEALRNESVRSVSAPAGARAPLSIIEKRRLEAADAAAQTKSRIVEEMAKQKAQQEALARQQAEAAAKELEELEDADESELLRRELEAPIVPSESLADFITYQSPPAEETSKTGIPAQIERLYQDVNRMVDTVGLNSRALTAFVLYQQSQEPNQSWPSALNTDTPLDVLNDEWLLGDIPTLQEGCHLLEAKLNDSQIDDVPSKLQQCQTLLSQDLLQLRTKINSIRKTLNVKQTSSASLAPSLSAEQASVQQDLRKASASVRSKLAQAEDALAILRAKLAEAGAVESESKRTSLLGRSVSQKKPTVEAVMNTISKMTHMAETKSADIDLLEAQLRKLKVGTKSGLRSGNVSLNGTPRTHARSLVAITPGSGRGSVYHTPDSKLNSSVRSTTATTITSPKRQDPNAAGLAIAEEDKVKWQNKARREKEAAAVLRAVLAERRKQAAKAKA
ncbi:hypothetical protein DV738_g1330, partial [Chaetothyriales sp. CBS 135597]